MESYLNTLARSPRPGTASRPVAQRRCSAARAGRLVLALLLLCAAACHGIDPSDGDATAAAAAADTRVDGTALTSPGKGDFGRRDPIGRDDELGNAYSWRVDEEHDRDLHAESFDLAREDGDALDTPERGDALAGGVGACHAEDRLLMTAAGDVTGWVRVWDDGASLYVETEAVAGWEMLSVRLYAAPTPPPEGLSSVLFPFVDEPMHRVVHSELELLFEELDVSPGEEVYLALNAQVAPIQEADVDPTSAWAFAADQTEPTADARVFAYPLCGP